mgnify:CR=1 FL=1
MAAREGSERMERQSFNLCDGSKERHLANIKDNELVSGYVTPMAYGIAVLPKGTKPEAGKKVLTFQEALSEIEDVSKQKAAMKMHKH